MRWAIGGAAVNENLEATPLAEDGFLYVVDAWGVVYKIDAPRGRCRPPSCGAWNPGQEKMPDANRGAALWGAFVVSVANYPPRVIATSKETGKGSRGETNLSDGQANLQFTAAPQAVKDKIILGASGGDNGGARFRGCGTMPRPASFSWRQYIVPAPGEPGSETWKDKKQRPGRPAAAPLWVTGSYDTATNQIMWGTGNSGAVVGPLLSARRQPVHRKPDLVGPRHRQDELVSPVSARRHVGL